MPRLRQVSRADAGDNVRKYYDALFGDRDPVAEPGTATGTPGNWWTVFALVPYIFDHATSHFGMFGMFADKSVSQLDGGIREIAIMRAVGTGTRRLTAMLTLENLSIAVIGILIGIPAGAYIANYFFLSMSTSTEDVVSITLTIFPRSYIIATISALVILLISQIPAIRQVSNLSLATATKDWSE